MQDRSNWTVRKVTFAEAEELDLEYYASISWKESARTVEGMRQQFWWDEYPGQREKIVRRATLKELTDDFE